MMKTIDKWQTLQHKGPVFPAAYENKGWKIIVAGKEYRLEGLAEEMAYAWAQKHATDYIKDKVFITNFWRDFKTTLPKELKTSSFPKDWDFKYFVREIEYAKEVKKNRSKEVKKAEKEATAARKAEYGFATIDGNDVPLGNFTVEPSGLFMGRGEHPLRGSWKHRIEAEDITLNHSADIPAPAAPEGHTWKGVIENKNKVELAGWNCKLTGKWKPILFNAVSVVKQGADQMKFNKAIKLAGKLESINTEIDTLLDSKIKQTRKIATCAKLIAQLAIRMGDEKGENEADTVGASSLRVEHIKEITSTTVELDFLGKDSIRYHNIVKFSPSMIRNITWLCKDKKPSDSLFLGVTPSDVNEFIGNIESGVTAKMFRTAYGSKLLAEELAKEDVSALSPAKKLQYFTDANLTVAKKLNHQTAVSPAYKESLKNMKVKLKEVKAELIEKKKEMKPELEAAKALRDERVAAAKKRYTGTKQKDSVRRAKATYTKKVEMWEKRIDRLKTRVENQTAKIEIKDKTAGIALGTSKTNYSDPRIAYSFCKENNLESKRIFTPILQNKFEWAADTDSSFYKNYPEV